MTVARVEIHTRETRVLVLPSGQANEDRLTLRVPAQRRRQATVSSGVLEVVERPDVRPVVLWD